MPAIREQARSYEKPSAQRPGGAGWWITLARYAPYVSPPVFCGR